MIAITPLLKNNGSQPLYTQLYQYIRSQIESGSLAPGDKLPSIRQLAAHLDVSKNTVDSAYAQLLAEGYVDSRERGGYIVLPLDEPVERQLPAKNKRLFHWDNETDKPPLYDFQYGDVAYEQFPHAKWRACMLGALEHAEPSMLGYGHPLGLPELRREIAGFVYESRGVACQPDQILICSGTQHAVSMLCQLLNLRERRIGMEEPGYCGVKTVLQGYGCRVEPIEVEEDGISLPMLEQTGVDTVYVTPSHQFPLGMVMPIQKRIQLLQWADRHGGWILEDDYDSEFRYNSRPIPSLKALDTGDRVIYMGTMSKCFMPALRLSYVILPAELVQRFEPVLQHYSQAVSPLIQQAAALFMKHGHFERHIRRMRRLYQSRHRALGQAVKQQMGDRVELIGDRSGLHVLLDVKSRRREELMLSAAQAGCKIYSPAKHWNDPSLCPPSYVMLGFGALSEEQIGEGIERLGRAWFGTFV